MAFPRVVLEQVRVSPPMLGQEVIKLTVLGRVRVSLRSRRLEHPLVPVVTRESPLPWLSVAPNLPSRLLEMFVVMWELTRPRDLLRRRSLLGE